MTAAAVTRSSPWLAALVASALFQAGCGGGSGNLTLTYTKIDDMEGLVAVGWGTVTDCSQYDRIEPPPFQLVPEVWPYADLPAAHETMPGIMSTQAVRLRTTSPLVSIWGANVTLTFAGAPIDGGIGGAADGGAVTDDAGVCRQPIGGDFPATPIDLTPFSGITFWARAEAPGGRILRVQVIDTQTDPRGGICQEQDNEASDYCYNGFGVQIELTDTYRQYTLEFSKFTQVAGWGYHPPSGIDWSRVYTLNFVMNLPGCTDSAATMCPGGAPSLSFDFWIDDLYFVNK